MARNVFLKKTNYQIFYNVELTSNLPIIIKFNNIDKHYIMVLTIMVFYTSHDVLSGIGYSQMVSELQCIHKTNN